MKKAVLVLITFAAVLGFVYGQETGGETTGILHGMTGGAATGGAMTGGILTGGAMTGGAMTGGAMTGGSN